MTFLKVSGNTLRWNDHSYPCAVGKNGFNFQKREGDGCTPIGRFQLRECWFREDRIKGFTTGLLQRRIHEDDGWCDDTESPVYNTHVKLPFGMSHEKLWRDDHAYDLIIPIGYNDIPAVPGLGSAIFLHVALPGYTPTEGCVALAAEHLLEILPLISGNTHIEIEP